MKWILVFLLVPCLAFAKSHRKRRASAKASAVQMRLTKVGECSTPQPSKKVLVLKQWHLAPQTITKGFKEKYAQEKNQTAIYKFLADSIKRGDLQLIVSEGCEGEINDSFKPSFNGWDYTSLKVQSQTKNYDRIITLIPLKVEAKYGDKIATYCGDKESLIQEGNLRLSNLRGWMGYTGCLRQSNGDSEKIQNCAESVSELLKVPKDTTREKLLALIKERVDEDLNSFSKSLNDRNDSFVKTLVAQEYTRAAIVIGGLHAVDLKDKLEKAGLGCEIYEPPGYQRNDENLIQDFRRNQ